MFEAASPPDKGQAHDTAVGVAAEDEVHVQLGIALGPVGAVRQQENETVRRLLPQGCHKLVRLCHFRRPFGSSTPARTMLSPPRSRRRCSFLRQTAPAASSVSKSV